VLQKEVVPLPKSTNPGHIKQNSELNFEISATDMEYLDRLTGTIKGLKLSKIKSRVKKKLIAFEVLLRKMKFPLSIF
jgi:diketogulonate reductase-like aldo/keto reductase